MSDQPKWMPDTELLCMAFDLSDQAWEEIIDGERGPDGSWLDPLRAVVRSAVERALAEQEARHWREVIEARIEEIGKGLHVLMSGGVVSGKAHAPEFRESHCVFCRNIGILRAQLTALEEVKPYGWTSFEWAKEMRAKLAALDKEVKP